MIPEDNLIRYGKKIREPVILYLIIQNRLISYMFSFLSLTELKCTVKKKQTQHVCSCVVEDTIYINIKYFYKETFFVF